MTTATSGTACNATGTRNPGKSRTRILFLLAGGVTLLGVTLRPLTRPRRLAARSRAHRRKKRWFQPRTAPPTTAD